MQVNQLIFLIASRSVKSIFNNQQLYNLRSIHQKESSVSHYFKGINYFRLAITSFTQEKILFTLCWDKRIYNVRKTERKDEKLQQLCSCKLKNYLYCTIIFVAYKLVHYTENVVALLKLIFLISLNVIYFYFKHGIMRHPLYHGKTCDRFCLSHEQTDFSGVS